MSERVAVAAANELAAGAGAWLADEGGNAADAAVAATVVAMITEPGICGLGSGGFATVWSPGDAPVTVDGDVEMPGRGLAPERFGGDPVTITTAYAGGVTMSVGHRSVATPGALAALESVSRRFGRAPWRAVLEPAIDHARRGFPLGSASHHYLGFVHESVYGWQPESYSALHDAEGRLVGPGETVRVADLADSLELIADEGTRAFYEGDIAALIAADMEAHGGILTRRDLAAYRAVERAPLRAEVGPWEVATNPPPAVGGAVLVAMLRLLDDLPRRGWDAAEVARLVEVQRAVLGFRHARLDVSEDLEAAVSFLLDRVDADDLDALVGAPSTVHTSTVGSQGLACAVTASAGYGSGVVVPGTGIWLNNCLGEAELNRRGFHALEPGERLISNMAPTIAREGYGRVLAVGSPGADRITTAILQTLLNVANGGMSLADAIANPRVHVDVTAEDGPRVLAEGGTALDDVTLPTQVHEEPHMLFGGVAAAQLRSGEVEAAADPRRAATTASGGR